VGPAEGTIKRSRKPSPAQQRATANNNCLRVLVGLRTAFVQAGHYDFEKFAEDLEAKFRAKLKETSK
jgi:hypothetical protein